MKVVKKNGEVVVVELRNKDRELGDPVGADVPMKVRIFPDRLEMDCNFWRLDPATEVFRAKRHRKVFAFDDLLLMNEVIKRIARPKA